MLNVKYMGEAFISVRDEEATAYIIQRSRTGIKSEIARNSE